MEDKNDVGVFLLLLLLLLRLLLLLLFFIMTDLGPAHIADRSKNTGPRRLEPNLAQAQPLVVRSLKENGED